MSLQYRINRHDIVIGDEICTGGQGKVYFTDKRLQSPDVSLVYKEYLPDAKNSLNLTTLSSMVAYLHNLNVADAVKLLSICAWPCYIVFDNDDAVGILMPKASDNFYFDLKLPSGSTVRRIGEIQYLLTDNKYRARGGIFLNDPIRKKLLIKTAEALRFLHVRGIIVGDFSAKNMLFALTPTPKIFFLDCDSMMFRGKSVLPQAETPGWEYSPNSKVTSTTVESDHRKLALLALRLFVGDQETRDYSLLAQSKIDWLNKEIVPRLTK